MNAGNRETRVAAVVGGAGAIGSAICRQLLIDGFRVYSLDLQPATDSAVESVVCDVRDAGSVAEAFATIENRESRLDAMVYSAGISRDAVVWKLGVEDWDLVQSVNLRGAFLAIRSAMNALRKVGRGRIVLIGSINGSRGKFGTAAYSASKAGLIGMARSVSREAGRFGVTVNVVEPGMVRTPLTQDLPGEVLEAAVRETLLGELVEPDDVAALVSMLCGPRGVRITGQVIRVDAGQFLGGA